MNKLHTCLFALLVVALSGCTDHRTQDLTPGSATARLRVSSITQPMTGGTSKISQFIYDGQNRLSRITTYQTPDSTVSEVEQTTYQYDGQNRLTQVRQEATLYPRGNQPNRVAQYTYGYNAAGQVTSIAYANGYTVSPVYSASGVLQSARRFFATGGLTINGGDAFTFTGANLTTYTISYTVAGHGGPAGPPSSLTRTYTYDTNINPFYGTTVIPAPYPDGYVNLASAPGSVVTYFGGVDNVLNLSPANVLTETASTGETNTYLYQYNAAGLPTMRTRTTTGSGTNSTQTLQFSYESY